MQVPHWSKLQVMLAGIWPGNTPWEPGFHVRLLFSHAATCLSPEQHPRLAHCCHSPSAEPWQTCQLWTGWDTTGHLGSMKHCRKHLWAWPSLPSSPVLLWHQERCWRCVRGHKACPQHFRRCPAMSMPFWNPLVPSPATGIKECHLLCF